MLHLSPPPGGSAISTARILYVETTGDNATAVIGNPSKPFATAQGAFDAAFAGSGNYHIQCGVGSFGTVTLPAGGWPSRITIAGAGYKLSTLTSIIGDGNAGSNGSNHATTPTAGTAGGNGKNITIYSDGSIYLGSINSNGGNGGEPGQYLNNAGELVPGSDGVAGANGGDAGDITLVNVVYGLLSNNGGVGGAGGNGQVGGVGTLDTAGGNGGNGGVGGNGGRRGAVVLHDCRCTAAGGGDIMSENGLGGAGGTEGLGGTDNGGGAGSNGSAGGAGSVPSGFSKDFILVNSGIGAVVLHTTDGEEIMANVLHESLFVDGSSTPSVGGDLGGNIATEVHKLP